MTGQQVAAQYYKHATGWLGWDPQTALATPMPLIRMAFEGLVDFHKAQNGVEDKPAPTPETKEAKRRDVAKRMDKMFAAIPQRG